MYWDTVVQVAGSNFTTSSASLVDITGLTYAATANSVYEIEAALRVQGSDGNGIKFGWNYSAVGATGVATILVPNTGVTNSNIGFDTTGVGAASGSHVAFATTDCAVFIRLIAVIGANSGNITLQTLKFSAGTATVYVGSVMKIKKLA